MENLIKKTKRILPQKPSKIKVLTRMGYKIYARNLPRISVKKTDGAYSWLRANKFDDYAFFGVERFTFLCFFTDKMNR